MNSRIITIAKDIRRCCEIYAMSSCARKYDFYGYRNLSCMCAVASFTLKAALRREGIHSEVIYGSFRYDNHCWVEVEGHIVDITASQFDMPDIHIVSSSDNSYKKIKVCRRPSSLRGWPYTQYPSPTTTRDILLISS